MTRAEVEAIEKFARMAAGDAAVRLSPEDHDAIEGKNYVAGEGHLTSSAMEILLREDVKVVCTWSWQATCLASHLPSR